MSRRRNLRLIRRGAHRPGQRLDQRASRWTGGTALVLAAAWLAGCSDKLQHRYSIEIVAPLGTDPFVMAETVAIELAGREIARRPVPPGGQSFSVEGTGIDTGTVVSGSLVVKGLAGDGKIVAYGRTPDFDVQLGSVQGIRVFVQAPGTLGRATDLALSTRNHAAVAAPARPSTGLLPMTAALFGLGQIDISAASGGTQEYSDALLVWNPIALGVESVGGVTTVGTVPRRRAETAALVRADGTVLLYGGITMPPAAMPQAPQYTSQLDVVRLRRISFFDFSTVADAPASAPSGAGLARSGATLVELGSTVYAYGGRDAQSERLGSVVRIQVGPGGGTFAVLDTPETGLRAPRAGHTATLMRPGGREVLLFGGADPAAPVAELHVPDASAPGLTGDPGPPRRDHAALSLPGNRVLIIGGAGPDGAPLGDSVLFHAGERRFEPGPIRLARPRSRFAAFIVGDDLVIAGGKGAGVEGIGDAEIYALATLAPRATIGASPRWGAAVAVLPHDQAVLLGGERDAGPVKTIEIYQPFRN